ncbi:MAG: heavy-metal-associated domain-containing protein [Desulfotomaculaceae bacterium]|nr:heavy-metal-associated domain-containing protein [Desulfotomaculaceae bacterium]
MEKIILKVWGMECGHCKATVQKALKGTMGVADVSIDLPTGEVAVTFDPTAVGLDKMKEVIKGVGYEVLD